MALEIHKLVKADTEDHLLATERLCLTEDDRLVTEDDVDARWLYCIAGAKVPLTDAERYGLVEAEVSEPEPQPEPQPEPGPEPQPEPEPEPEPTKKSKKSKAE